MYDLIAALLQDEPQAHVALLHANGSLTVAHRSRELTRRGRNRGSPVPVTRKAAAG
jgi:hypothetical protein